MNKASHLKYVHLNAALGTSTLVLLDGIIEEERYIKLNSAPYFDGETYSLEVNYGDPLWVTLPDLSDAEGNTPFTLVSFDYPDEEEKISLPDAADFFRINMNTNELTSKVFTSDHVGYHVLNVTIADT